MVVPQKSSYRKDLRVAVDFPVRIEPAEGGDAVEGRAWDLSGTGMLIAAPQGYLLGAMVRVELEVAGRTHPLHLNALVMRVRPALEESKDPKYMVALRFVQVSTAMARQLRRIVTAAVLEVGELLREFPAFSGLTEIDLLTLSGICHSVHADKGEVLIRQGQEAGALYLVVKGLLRLAPDEVKDHEIEAQEVVGCGQIFGEVSALTGLPHDLSVKALEPSSLIAISGAGLAYLKKSHPETMLRLMEVFMRVTGLRVRRLTRKWFQTARS